MTTNTISGRSLSLWRDQIHPRVLIKGDGPPLIYLHGFEGLVWNEFLDELAKTHTVYAPEFPGTTVGEHDAIKLLDDWHDLVVYYAELIDALGVKDPAVVGHSFGGMIAAEIDAANPGKVSKLVLLAPLGLWRDDLPIPPWLALNTEELAEVMYHDQDIAWRHLLRPEQASDQADRLLASIWALACAGKFTWPLPDRGLRDRLHRVAAETLLIWGDNDKLVPPAYAEDFHAGVAGSQLIILPGSGHALPQERPQEAARAVSEFLGS